MHADIRGGDPLDGHRDRVLAPGAAAYGDGSRGVRLQPAGDWNPDGPVPGAPARVGAVHLQLGHIWRIWYRFPCWPIRPGT